MNRKDIETSLSVKPIGFKYDEELYELCRIPSPSNYEGNLLEYLLKRISHLSLFKSHVDKKQALTLTYNGGHSQTVMLDAHIDQVHLRIVSILGDGQVLAIPVGFGQQVMDGNAVYHFKSGKIGTIITVAPHMNIPSIHTSNSAKSKKPVLIDFAMTHREAIEVFTIGDPIMFRFDYYKMNPNTVVSSGLDDKSAVVILLYLAEYYQQHPEELGVNLVLHFSTREELGYGSIAYLMNSGQHPDYIIVLDTEIATDSSKIPKDIIGNVSLNRGPVISRNYDDDMMVGDTLMKLAKNHKIPFQVVFSSSIGSSNGALYTEYFDSLTQYVGIPLRNMHSPYEVVSLHDIRHLSLLLISFLRDL